MKVGARNLVKKSIKHIEPGAMTRATSAEWGA
jgi:molybdopterin-binding protein